MISLQDHSYYTGHFKLLPKGKYLIEPNDKVIQRPLLVPKNVIKVFENNMCVVSHMGTK
jgi:hypothetical protein